MKISRENLQDCLNTLLAPKEKARVEYKSQVLKEVNEYTLSLLKKHNPKGYSVIMQINELSDNSFIYIKTAYRRGFSFLDYGFYDDHMDSLLLEGNRVLNEMKAELDRLREELSAIIKASKREDLIKEFPEIEKYLPVPTKVCTSLTCITQLKERLK